MGTCILFVYGSTEAALANCLGRLCVVVFYLPLLPWKGSMLWIKGFYWRVHGGDVASFPQGLGGQFF